MRTRRYIFCMTAAPALLIALIGRGPVTLRYIYKPGQSLLYTFTDSSSSVTRIDGRPEVTEYKQTGTGTLKKSIISVSGGEGVVDETPVRGSSERTDARGTTTQLTSPVTRRYTFTTLGRVLHAERIVPGGPPDATPQPFDGFSFTLPEKPVSPGATWAETLRAIGLDGKPIMVKAASTLRGEAMRAGHHADQIDVVFSSTFISIAAGATTPVTGSLRGTTTYYLARDLGQEAESRSEVTIVLKGTTTVDGKPRAVARTLHLAQTRTLAK